MDLNRLGWTPRLDELFVPHKAAGLVPGRIVGENSEGYLVTTAKGDLPAEVTGKFRQENKSRSSLPTVGDWVGVELPVGMMRDQQKGRITLVLPRLGCFSRMANGVEQIAAANVDVAFLVSSLDGDFNLRRIERYLVLAYEGGASPVVVLNKSDLCEQVKEYVAQIHAIAPGVPVHPVSTVRQTGLDALLVHLPLGSTGVLVGASGVGKSSLINAWLGRDHLQTGAVRDKQHGGSHTTTFRELIMLPKGGIVIDTPGVRELQLWASERTLATAFEDIELLAQECRFRDCRHAPEPGCAVKTAIENGTLPADRLGNYRKLGTELAALARRQAELKRASRKTTRPQIREDGRKDGDGDF